MKPSESFIGQPIRSLQTMLRVIAEDDPGHLKLIPDGIYGPETAAAIIRFQQKHRLPPTGVTDQGTWDAIVEAFEPALIRQDSAWPLNILLDPGQVIRRNEHHPNVFLIQGILAALSEIYGSISRPKLTGTLDEATADALTSFQRISGLPETGHIDKITWKHLALQYPLATARDSSLSDVRRGR